MTVKVALSGCGGWGKNLARNLAELGALALIVDPAESAKALAVQLGVAHSDTLDTALADPSIHGVLIATPAATHVGVATDCLNAGKHVYVEKPIALSVEEGLALGELAQAQGRILMVGHLLHYHPVYRALQNLVADDRLGAVRHIISNRMNLGMLRHEENVLWSFSPHDISMVIGLLGRAPQKVMATGNDFFQPGIVDVSNVQMRFDGGVSAEIRASWFHPQKEQKLTVVGDKAMAVFDDTAPWDQKLQIHDFDVEWSGPRPRAVRGDVEMVAVPVGEPLKAEMQHFLDCIANGTPPRTDAAEANRVLAVLQAAQLSLDEGGGWIHV
jgi:UDP-2-acetamido-3-amino-2,3-dideoxy-glucuronate N-acetyltransferase